MFQDNKRIDKVYWQDVRDQVTKSCPALARIFDDLALDREFPFYKVRYRYGELIVKRGVLQFPDRKGILKPVSDRSFPKEMRHDLYAKPGYEHIPPGIITQNSMEVGVAPPETVFPAYYYKKGDIFGLWGYLDQEITRFHPYNIFTLTSGARCVALLPKIGQRKGYDNIGRRLGFFLEQPKILRDQHQAFVKIVKHEFMDCDWCSELLFFSRPLIERIRSKDPKWLVLRDFLLTRVWAGSAYFRNKSFYDSAFSWAQANCNLKPDPYLADTAKYLVAIASGSIVGFVPATDETALPVEFIQNAFVNGYGLRKYVPTIMHPGHFNPFDKKHLPVYYSLHFPTTAEFSPRSRKDSLILGDLCELRHITERFLEELASGNVCMENTVLEHVAKNVSFEFFHHRQDKYGETESTREIPKRDPRFLISLTPCKNKAFCTDSTFMQGCVRIGWKCDEKEN